MVFKRGLGHVEAVITLVIFIGFLIFAFTFFSPFRTSRTLTSTLDYAWREVTDFTSENIETYSVVIDSSAPPIVLIAIPGTDDRNATVLDSSGKSVQSYTDKTGVHFGKPSDNFAVLQYSNNFDKGDSSISGNLLSSDSYIISSSDSKSVRFENLFMNLNNTYYSDYLSLKKDFNLPNRVDFGFSVFFSDGKRIDAYKDIPEGVEVLSKNDRLEIIRIQNGKNEYAEVNVKVW